MTNMVDTKSIRTSADLLHCSQSVLRHTAGLPASSINPDFTPVFTP